MRVARVNTSPIRYDPDYERPRNRRTCLSGARQNVKFGGDCNRTSEPYPKVHYPNIANEQAPLHTLSKQGRSLHKHLTPGISRHMIKYQTLQHTGNAPTPLSERTHERVHMWRFSGTEEHARERSTHTTRQIHPQMPRILSVKRFSPLLTERFWHPSSVR